MHRDNLLTKWKVGYRGFIVIGIVLLNLQVNMGSSRAESETAFVIKAIETQVHEGPGIASPTVTSLPQGTEVIGTNKDGSWIKIRVPAEGWIVEWDLGKIEKTTEDVEKSFESRNRSEQNERELAGVEVREYGDGIKIIQDNRSPEEKRAYMKRVMDKLERQKSISSQEFSAATKIIKQTCREYGLDPYYEEPHQFGSRIVIWFPSDAWSRLTTVEKQTIRKFMMSRQMPWGIGVGKVSGRDVMADRLIEEH